MKKLLLLIIFLFSLSGQVGFGQGDFTRIYHPIINSAELAIVDTNYYEALDYYKAAFDNVKKPFAKDYYNAAICAAMLGKTNTVFDYLEKMDIKLDTRGTRRLFGLVFLNIVLDGEEASLL